MNTAQYKLVHRVNGTSWFIKHTMYGMLLLIDEAGHGEIWIRVEVVLDDFFPVRADS